MARIAHYKCGNCNIYIDDKYMVKTEEEKHKILRDIGDFYTRCFEEGKLKLPLPEPKPSEPLIEIPLTEEELAHAAIVRAEEEKERQEKERMIKERPMLAHRKV